MKRHYLGVDLGTTAVKVVLFDEEGTPLTEASEELCLLYPAPDHVEQSPSSWFEIPCALIRKVCQGIDPTTVRGIGISSQGITLIPVDRDFRALCDGLSWLDNRAEEEMREILSILPEEELFALTGKHPLVCYTLPKLLWLKKHRPALFEEAAMFLLPLDYLTARLCGKAITEATMAGGTLLHDIKENCWSSALCDTFGIPEEKLPRIFPTEAYVGTLTAEAQALTGLPAEVFVAVGAQDQKIAAYGAGITPGTVTMSLGTAGALEMLCPHSSDVLPSFVFATEERSDYILEACINTFGAAIKWARDTVFVGLSYRDMDALAEKAPIGSSGVCFYPHLSGVGMPHYGKELRSGFTGMTLATDRACMIRALYEGLACEVRMNLEAASRVGAEIKRLRIFGGGSKSDILCHILADITGVTVDAMVFTEIASFGAAKAAAVCDSRREGFPSSFALPAEVKTYAPAHREESETLFRHYTDGQLQT